MAKFLTRIFGSRNQRLLRQYGKVVNKINALEESLQALDDAALRAMTDQFKRRYADGETLEALLPEAFAVAREAARRTLGLRPFDVQLVGGVLYVPVGDLTDVDQSVLVHADIDKGPELGDIGNQSGQPHPRLKVINAVDPLAEGEQDPFANAAFVLATELPDGPQNAVVQEHSFSLVDEASARDVADQLGFSGPLYVQRIAPEFTPPAGEDQFNMFTAFDGARILNISDNGATLEDRGVVIDYDNQPSVAAAALVLSVPVDRARK